MNDRETRSRTIPAQWASRGADHGVGAGGTLFGATGGPGDGPTRRDLLRFLFRYRLTITLCTLVVGAVVGGVMYMLPPTYETGARVLVKTEDRAGPTFFGGSAAFREAQIPRATAPQLETEMQLLLALPLSAEVVGEVQVREEQLYRSPMSHIVSPFVHAYGWFRENVMGRPKGVPDTDRLLAEGLRKSIHVSAAPSMTGEGVSSVISVSLRAADPVMARDALDALLRAYLKSRGESDAMAGRTAARILEQEVADVDLELRLAEDSLRDFVARQGATGRPGLLTVARVDAALGEQRAQLARLEASLTEARQTYTETSAPVVTLQGQIASLRDQIAREIATGAAADARYGELSRALVATEQRHSELQRRLVEARLFEAVMTQPLGDRTVLEPPLLPDGSDWKKRVVITVLGVIAGLCLGLALAGLRSLTDTRLRTKEDVVRKLGLPVLGTLPPQERRPTAGRRLDGARGLAARLATMVGDPPGGGGRVVLVTSVRDGDGKSAVAQELAEQLAENGHGRVLLVRGSALRPARQLAAGAASSSTAARAEASEGDAADEGAQPRTRAALLEPIEEGAAVAGPPTVLDLGNGAGDLLTSLSTLPGDRHSASGGRLGAFLGRVSSVYDWTIVDSVSVDDGEAHLVAQDASAVVLVLDATTTRREVVNDALRGLHLHPDVQVAVVLNRAEHEIPSFLYERI